MKIFYYKNVWEILITYKYCYKWYKICTPLNDGNYHVSVAHIPRSTSLSIDNAHLN